MKKRFKIFAVTVVLILSGLLYGYYGFLYKPLRNVGNEEAVANVSAQELVSEYAANTASANAKYLNATVGVAGKVTEIRDSLMILDGRVVCGFDSMAITADINKQITIKGKCIGYDELFGEVKLDQCIIQ